ncbi:MAG: serine/threonine protein kinase [Deltaproteobacteria bacterium]|nr:serine/threonine protein kinase [Deltaproteobacteria bacterium]
MGSRYRLVRLIRKGGTAEVFDAIAVGELGFERRVALKRLAASNLGDPSFERSFVDEARIASQLHHANIVAVLDFGLMDGQPFQILEHVDGSDLRELLDLAKARGERLPLELVLHIGLELCHALTYAHDARDARGRSLGIVHRDVSPENILVAKTGEVKLADFGIARARDRLERTEAGVAKGKLSYMAPEQMRAEAVDRRTDLFALGCVLAEVVTGASPQATEAGRDALLRGQDPRLDPSIPAELMPILTRATRASRERRYDDAAALGADLGAVLARRGAGDLRLWARAWLASRAAQEVSPSDRGLGALLDVELLLRGSGPVRRFESVALAMPSEGETPLPRGRSVMTELVQHPSFEDEPSSASGTVTDPVITDPGVTAPLRPRPEAAPKSAPVPAPVAAPVPAPAPRRSAPPGELTTPPPSGGTVSVSMLRPARGRSVMAILVLVILAVSVAASLLLGRSPTAQSPAPPPELAAALPQEIVARAASPEHGSSEPDQDPGPGTALASSATAAGTPAPLASRGRAPAASTSPGRPEPTDLRALRAAGDLAIREALERRGLSRADLHDDVEGRRLLREVRNAKTEPALRDSVAALRAHVDRLPVDRALLGHKLRRVAALLGRGASLPEQEFAPLESRYLQLASRAAAARDTPELISIARELERLTSDVHRAGIADDPRSSRD